MAVIPETMRGVYLTGFGGYDKLEYREDIFPFRHQKPEKYW